jgi:hypothetical protein
VPPTQAPLGRKPTRLNIDEVGPLKLETDVFFRVASVAELRTVETFWFLFGLGKTASTQTHLKWAKILAKQMNREPDCVVEMYGLADTTGSNKRNFEVAGQRLANFQAALRSAGAPPKKVFGPAHKNLGEEFAATRTPDDTPDQVFRVLAFYIWSDEVTRALIYNDNSSKPGRFLKFARNFKR